MSESKSENKRAVMIHTCQDFTSNLEDFSKDKDITFSLGKMTFAIDPSKEKDLKIKAEFTIKESALNSMIAKLDKSQTTIQNFNPK